MQTSSSDYLRFKMYKYPIASIYVCVTEQSTLLLNHAWMMESGLRGTGEASKITLNYYTTNFEHNSSNGLSIDVTWQICRKIDK